MTEAYLAALEEDNSSYGATSTVPKVLHTLYVSHGMQCVCVVFVETCAIEGVPNVQVAIIENMYVYWDFQFSTLYILHVILCVLESSMCIYNDFQKPEDDCVEIVKNSFPLGNEGNE